MDLDAVRDALPAAEVVSPHTDADGLSAGAMVLRPRGEGAGDVLLLEPGGTPWGPREALPEDLAAIPDHGHPRATGGSLPPHLFSLRSERLQRVSAACGWAPR